MQDQWPSRVQELLTALGINEEDPGMALDKLYAIDQDPGETVARTMCAGEAIYLLDAAWGEAISASTMANILEARAWSAHGDFAEGCAY